MKTIGEQAKEFREGMGWGFARMVEEINKHTEDGLEVQRQSYTKLESVGDRMPGYLLQLAYAMGTKPEVLLKGEYVFGRENIESDDLPKRKKTSPAEALEIIAQAIANSPRRGSRALAGAIEDWSKDPTDESTIQTLLALL